MDTYELYYNMTRQLLYTTKEEIDLIFKEVSHQPGMAVKFDPEDSDELKMDARDRSEIDMALDGFYRGDE